MAKLYWRIKENGKWHFVRCGANPYTHQSQLVQDVCECARCSSQKEEAVE